MLAKYDSNLKGHMVVTAESEGARDDVGEDVGGGVGEDCGRSSRSCGGRPVTSYAETSARSKRRTSSDLSRSHDTDKLLSGTTLPLRIKSLGPG